MKRFLCFSSSSVFLLPVLFFSFFAVTDLSAQIGEVGGLRFQIVQPDGTALKPVDNEYRYKDKPVAVRVTTESSQTVFEISSPFVETGELSIGIETPGLKKLPSVDVRESNAVFKLSRSQSTVDWKGNAATFAVPQPRKELAISLAEYGAADQWKDVTRVVNRQLSGGALNFQGTNALFGGDPAPGVVKSLVLNYTLDEDDLISTFGENAWVRLQYNPKDYFHLLTPKGAATFKFTVKTE
ncbi:MAG: hypothetical protein LBQ50_14345 [Planctomycetaceae bacterium]|jgi:hypothetical protein|nr:hypothetical protein [Planctomycetaceae bacterium]